MKQKSPTITFEFANKFNTFNYEKLDRGRTDFVFTAAATVQLLEWTCSPPNSMPLVGSVIAITSDVGKIPCVI